MGEGVSNVKIPEELPTLFMDGPLRLCATNNNFSEQSVIVDRLPVDIESFWTKVYAGQTPNSGLII